MALSWSENIMNDLTAMRNCGRKPAFMVSKTLTALMASTTTC